MISKQIIVTVTPPSAIEVWSPPKTIKSQEEYKEFLDKLPFGQGGFVTMSPKDMLSSLYHIHFVAELETDFTKVAWTHYPGKPKPLLLVACAAPTNMELKPWTRWDSIEALRVVTQEEYDKYIKESCDNIQNSCLELAAEYKRTSPG